MSLERSEVTRTSKVDHHIIWNKEELIDIKKLFNADKILSNQKSDG